jgi:hypothetical protein
MLRQYALKGQKLAVRTPDRADKDLRVGKVKSTAKMVLNSRCAYWRCRKPFNRNPHQKNHDYCSPNCRKRAWDEKHILRLAIAGLIMALEDKGGMARLSDIEEKLSRGSLKIDRGGLKS